MTKLEDEVNKVLNYNEWTGIRKSRFNDFMNIIPFRQKEWLEQYYQLKKFMSFLNSRNIFPIRQLWERVITCVCLVDAEKPCCKCNNCWKKFIQLLIVIKCASGVSDKVVITHWFTIFNRTKYMEYGLDDWNNLDDETFAAICQKCSCWIKNTMYLKNYFRYLTTTRRIPSTVNELMMVAGFSLKSATLILQTLQNKPIMVAVDRHLSRSFLCLGWVHKKASSPTECSIHVGQWLPKEEFIAVNNVIAGLCQLLQGNTTKHRVLRLANQFGVKSYIDILHQASKGPKKSAKKQGNKN